MVVIVAIFGAIMLIVALVLPIWGFLIRFSHTGKLCSGDYYEKEDHPKPYLWETGDWIYFVVMLYLITLFLLFTACCCIIVIIVKNPEAGR